MVGPVVRRQVAGRRGAVAGRAAAADLLLEQRVPLLGADQLELHDLRARRGGGRSAASTGRRAAKRTWAQAAPAGSGASGRAAQTTCWRWRSGVVHSHSWRRNSFQCVASARQSGAPCRARELVAKIFSVFVLGFRIFCVVCESRHTHARSLGAEPRPVRLYQVFLSHPVCFPFLFLYSTLSFPLYFPGETPWKSSNFGL